MKTRTALAPCRAEQSAGAELVNIYPCPIRLQLNLFPEEIFDEDGCYDPKNYMALVNRFDQFQSFSDILGK